MKRTAARLFAILAAAAVLLWIFGPYEPVELHAAFNPARFSEDVPAYFAAREAALPDIRPGTEKRVIWAGAPGEKTGVVVVYLHGFSASSEEIRPVPDRIAQALGANLVYTRLAGHGRTGPAMAEPAIADWTRDTAEALAAARMLGEQVVIVATSTGATLAVAAAMDPVMSQDVVAMVLVSPNFGINSAAAPLLTFPAARHWLPLIAGRTRDTRPDSAEEARFWTTSYPSVALMPMAALVQEVRGLDVSRIPIPALFWFSPEDRVVRPDLTQDIARRWGGPVAVRLVTMGPGDDPNAHVVAGAIKSPGQTDLAVTEMTAWLKNHLD